MASLVTDTNAWIAFFQSEDSTIFEIALSAGELGIPALVKLELLGNKLTNRERRQLEDLLSGIQTLGLTDDHIQRAAKLKGELEAKGIFLSARDAHIIQCARDEGAALLSNDPLFVKIQDSTAVKVQMW